MSSNSIETFVIDQIRCPECCLTCLQKNIYRHMSQIHGWNREDCKVLITAIRTEKKGRDTKTSFICSFCRAMFKTIRHLVQHKKICSAQTEDLTNEDDDDGGYMQELIVEQEEVVDDQNYVDVEEHRKPSTSSYDCGIPPHRHTVRAIPAHHIPTEKTTQPIKEETVKFPMLGRHRGTHTKCPECTETVESIEDLLAHCQEKHNTGNRNFLVEKQLFESREEFKRWFDQRQEDTCTSLTKRTGHGGETFYRCHRVGKYQSVAKARKSNPRKIDQTCTAYLKVFVQEDGSIWAHGCFTHIGHELDHKLLWLTETQEKYVRELIDLGWSSDQIFFYIREEYKNIDCKLKYISKNDIRNITVRYSRKKGRCVTSRPTEEALETPKPEIGRVKLEGELPNDFPEDREKESIKRTLEALLHENESEEVEKKRVRHSLTSSPEAKQSTSPQREESESHNSEKPPSTEEDNEYINVVDDEPSSQQSETPT